MELQLANENKSIEVADSTFGRDFNEHLVHQLVVAYMAGGRAGTRAHRNRAAVRGGGAKPWRQKGTGRARAGTIRSPLWRGGGKTFAAVPRDYSQKVNRKMYRAGMRSILSELVRQDRLVVVASLEIEAPKTRLMAARLKELGVGRGVLITSGDDVNIFLAARNLPGVEVLTAAEINPVDLVGADKVVITVDALKQVEEWLA